MDTVEDDTDNSGDNFKSLTGISLEHSEGPPKSDSGISFVGCNQSSCTPQTDLVELARLIQKGDEFTKNIVHNKLAIIAEQVRFLQEQARQVLEEAKQSTDLYHVTCKFRKVPSNVYYLYLRPNGKQYFSLLSPQEWGESCPHNFIGAYRLENDLTWTPDEEISQKNKGIPAIGEIMYSTALKRKNARTGDTYMDLEEAQ